MAKKRVYHRDARGRFTSTGGTRRGKVRAGTRRAGTTTHLSTGVDGAIRGRQVAVNPQVQLSRAIYRSDRVTVSGNVTASRNPRLTLGAGLNASVTL